MSAAKIQSPAQAKYLADMAAKAAAKESAVKKQNREFTAVVVFGMFFIALMIVSYKINVLGQEFNFLSFFVKPVLKGVVVSFQYLASFC